MTWHERSVEETYAHFRSSSEGLSHDDVRERLAVSGPNALPEARRSSYAVIFLRQFASPLIYLLLVATAAVLAMGEWGDAAIIAAVLLINAAIGTVQEGRAQSALAALKKLTATESVVLRDGREMIVPSRDLVPGDVLVLREGGRISADARIVRADSLMTDESALTGESVPVEKTPDVIEGVNLPLGDQRNMAWSGTYVTSGAGLALIVATGSHTELGSISIELADLNTDLPLKKQVRKLSHVILAVVAVSSAALLVGGLLSGMELASLLSIVVAVAVSVTPEGLPVVVTLILAAGVSRMSRKNALVKNLQAVEALGQADIIAVDKTGTITLNQMMISEISVGGNVYQITGNGYDPRGEAVRNGAQAGHDDTVLKFAEAGALTSSAHVGYSEELGMWQRISGDPTEAAFTVLGAKFGFSKEVLMQDYRKFYEEPFTSDLRYHAVGYEHGRGRTVYVAGAPETILGLCTGLSDARHVELEASVDRMSSAGLRVIALASRSLAKDETSSPDVRELDILGLAGIADTIRPSVHDAVARAHGAGIRVVMITGDYAATAQALATQVGIYREGDAVITGQDILSWTPDELASRIGAASVFARVSPEDKMKIVQAYRAAGLVIAMTGDGVNDALPLAAADLGVSMGKIGTEVAKEASDIVLLDDDFGSIVLAVEEGRAIYRTIKKVVLYLLSTSLAELAVIGGALALGLPIPFSATQIIWLNFVTDGFLVAALATARKEDGLLSRAWTAADQNLLDRPMVIRMVAMAVVMAAGTLAIFAQNPISFLTASTMALTTLAAYQWFNALNASSDRSILNFRMFDNKYLLVSLAAVVGLHAGILYVPTLARLFDTVPLTGVQVGVSVAVALSIVVFDELIKLVMGVLNKS